MIFLQERRTLYFNRIYYFCNTFVTFATNAFVIFTVSNNFLDCISSEFITLFSHLTTMYYYIIINTYTNYKQGDIMELHKRIREVREERCISQSVIASVLHVGQRTYCDYESGKTRIPVEHLKRLGTYYNLCIDYLSGASDVKKEFPKE